MMSLKRKIITQVGSLPYDNPDESVEYSLKHDIPFLPELPKRGDAMLDYIKNPGSLSCLEKFKKHEYSTVKIQCVGPATLVLSGYSSDDAVSRCYGHISALMDGLSAEEVILFLDEPALGQIGIDYKKLWDALFSSFDVIPGVHTCGNMNWDELFDSDIEIISFDASKFDLTAYPKYRNGKRIAWGIEKEGDVKDFREGDLLTLPCGMGPQVYRVDDCKIKLEMLQRISTRIFP